MTRSQVVVKFEPHGRTVFTLSGTKVVEAAASAGLTLDTPCGGAGKCGKCRVRLMSGAGEPTPVDRSVFAQSELSEGWRLACQTALHNDAVVFVPEASLFASRHQILETAHTDSFEELRPGVRKCYVELSAPSLRDDAPDLLRLEAAIGPCRLDLPLLREVPQLLRRHDFKGTAVLAGRRLLAFEPGDTTQRLYGVAFDIGTTTLVGVLLDLCSADTVATVSRMNPQVSFGDDVLSRIAHAGSGPGALEQLRRTIVDEVNDILDELCEQAEICREHIYVVSFAGNTTMEHLLCGVDPTQLGQVPFVPAYARGLLQRAAELGIAINPRGLAYVFPVIGGFVGGDTVAGMLATQLTSLPGPSLMVDIGTNGEIVLSTRDGIWAASTAAGPAFEGARISCGMRATRGAIEKVVINDDLEYSVIDNAPPMGLCGSGLIDLCAQLLNHGIIAPDGRLLPPDELPEALPEALKCRAARSEAGKVEFLLADVDVTNGPRLTLQEKDVRELQLASGAIRAGISILCKTAGIRIADIEHVLIAGGFGSFIRRSNAQRIGLLPSEVDARRITYVGNTSLSGAKWVVLSTASRERAEELARTAKHVELSNDADFATEFAMAMAFPRNPRA